MCGIVGFVSNKKFDFYNVLKEMIRSVEHRGPDDKGYLFIDSLNIGLAHARLSILDLSYEGHQPMISRMDKYTIVYNGEIYNHLNIRKELEKISKISWRGTSDTETILTAFEIWGVRKTIEKCVGMFAIALVDHKERSLYLIRDRMGEKPLYYGYVDTNFVFASDISSIKKMPNFRGEINLEALSHYMSYGSVSEPLSIYENIYKLEAGAILKYQISDKNIEIDKYWSIEELINKNNKFDGNYTEAVNKMEELLLESIRLQLISDVPIGAFLSGGVDSSLIAAMMQSVSNKKVETFTIGFEQKEYNEAEYAKSIANYIGTNHHETYITNQDALNIVPQLPYIFSEPFSESSQIPTFLVSKIAKKNITVSLSGDGGDELFGGYTRYGLSEKLWRKVSKYPILLRKSIYDVINIIPYDILYYMLLPIKGKKNKVGIPVNYSDKIYKGIHLLLINNRKDFYHLGFMNHNVYLNEWLKTETKLNSKFIFNKIESQEFYDEMMRTDLITYITNNNLTKVDRTAMYNSLETRVPLLDYRIVEFALSLPTEYKINKSYNKRVLKGVLNKYIPQHFFNRPKKGFSVPLNEWLRGPLKDWGAALIFDKKIENDSIFNVETVRNRWVELQSGKRNWQNQIWDVLVFQSWMNQSIKS